MRPFLSLASATLGPGGFGAGFVGASTYVGDALLCFASVFTGLVQSLLRVIGIALGFSSQLFGISGTDPRLTSPGRGITGTKPCHKSTLFGQTELSARLPSPRFGFT